MLLFADVPFPVEPSVALWLKLASNSCPPLQIGSSSGGLPVPFVAFFSPVLRLFSVCLILISWWCRENGAFALSAPIIYAARTCVTKKGCWRNGRTHTWHQYHDHGKPFRGQSLRKVKLTENELQMNSLCDGNPHVPHGGKTIWLNICLGQKECLHSIRGFCRKTLP